MRTKMNKTLLAPLGICALLWCASPASALAAKGGSGGTTGGNPKPVSTIKFNLDPVRAAKLSQAVTILRERLPQSCFPADYKSAMLAELNRLVNSGQLYYFPKAVMLGSDRYEGDYGEKYLSNGEHEFYEVGAFTKKYKGAPIFFTASSDSYGAEELAMTFAQDLNDHVLQWTSEVDLNTVGSMAMGHEECVPNDWRVYKVFEQFPEREPYFEARKKKFFDYFHEQARKNGLIHFGSIPSEVETTEFTPTRDGFTFVPKNYSYWTGEGVYKTVPAKFAQRFEVVFSPFDYLKQANLAADPEALSGFVRDPESGTILSEFGFSFKDKKDPLNMDPMCGTREFDSNNSVRLEIWRSGGKFDRSSEACAMKLEEGTVWIDVRRTKKDSCSEHTRLDPFNRARSVDDLSFDPFCTEGPEAKFTAAEYADIVGNKSPEQFTADLVALNEKHFNERKQIAPGSSLPWISKNLLGGRMDYLPDALTVVRDEKGALYSVTVAVRGVYLTADEVEDLEDDDDLAYQCFFGGPQAGTCLSHDYDD